MKKNNLITITIIILIIAFAIYVKTKPVPPTSEEIVICIGEKAQLYTQIGCHYCDEQEKLFGENVKYINNFICNSDEWETCRKLEIMGTPTWIINGEKYAGLKSIEKLKELTGC
jgi:hypothetical protein